MALNSSDFQDLKLTDQDLAKAVRDLTAILQKQTQTTPTSFSGFGSGSPLGATGFGGSVGGGLGAGGIGFGGGGAPKGEKSADATGLGLSATRSLLSAGGAPGASALLGSLSGGPASILAGGIGFGVGAIASSRAGDRAIREAGNRAFESGPITDTDEMRETRANFGEARQRRQNLQQGNFLTDIDDFFHPGQRERRDRSLAEDEVRARKNEEDALGPRQRAMQRTVSELTPFFQMGGFDNAAGQRMALDRLALNQKFEDRGTENLQHFIRKVNERAKAQSQQFPSSGVPDKQ